jgi:uncharacterized metal-binding protein YceD (DUF177 family)
MMPVMLTPVQKTIVSFGNNIHYSDTINFTFNLLLFLYIILTIRLLSVYFSCCFFDGFAVMKLFLSEITDSVNSRKVEFVTEGGELGDGTKVTGIDMNLDFYRAGETICLRFTGSYDVETVCDRCAVEIEMSSDIDESYYVFPRSAGNEVDYHYSGDSVELDEFIREILVMNMPDKILCSDECKGLCSVCGTNLNDEDCKCSGGE